MLELHSRRGVKQETLDTAVDELETLARFDTQIDAYETSPWRHTTLRQWGVDTGIPCANR